MHVLPHQPYILFFFGFSLSLSLTWVWVLCTRKMIIRKSSCLSNVVATYESCILPGICTNNLVIDIINAD